VSATAGLPAYTGPDRPCPGCGMPVVLTEYHPAAVLWPHEMAGHRPPCADLTHLARPAGRGQHLCRLCLNCGCGWPESCVGRNAALPSPAVCVLAASFASSLTATVAASIACLLLAGPARVAACHVRRRSRLRSAHRPQHQEPDPRHARRESQQ
jgi:hypothetical protein